MTLKFRNRKGEDITFDEVNELMGNHDYAVVERTHVGDYWVSTVWCPMAAHRNVLFATAIFHPGAQGELLSEVEHATEAEARLEHTQAITGLQGCIDAGIDFAGIMQFINGDRDEMPPMGGS